MKNTDECIIMSAFVGTLSGALGISSQQGASLSFGMLWTTGRMLYVYSRFCNSIIFVFDYLMILNLNFIYLLIIRTF